MRIDVGHAHAATAVITQRGYKPCIPAPALGRALAPDRIERGGATVFASLDLRTIEGDGSGHTLRRHVGVDDASLRARGQRLHHDASSFGDLATAQTAVDRAFRENQRGIGAWLARGTRRSLALNVDFDRPVGRVFRYDSGRFEETREARVVLERSNRMPQGITVITAYPEPVR